jgi:hypothetical protein
MDGWQIYSKYPTVWRTALVLATIRKDFFDGALDAIISVGYRVNSKRGVQFRQWSTRVLREHLVQGYTCYRRGVGGLAAASRLC